MGKADVVALQPLNFIIYIAKLGCHVILRNKTAFQVSKPVTGSPSKIRYNSLLKFEKLKGYLFACQPKNKQR